MSPYPLASISFPDVEICHGSQRRSTNVSYPPVYLVGFIYVRTNETFLVSLASDLIQNPPPLLFHAYPNIPVSRFLILLSVLSVRCMYTKDCICWLYDCRCTTRGCRSSIANVSSLFLSLPISPVERRCVSFHPSPRFSFTLSYSTRFTLLYCRLWQHRADHVLQPCRRSGLVETYVQISIYLFFPPCPLGLTAYVSTTAED